jgi:PAB1-binding protein PBP1
MVKKVVATDKQVNGATEPNEYCGAGQDHVMSFPIRDVADLHTPNVRLDKLKSRGGQNGASRFKTDTDISSGFAARERDLQRWDGGLESDVSMSLDGNTNGQPWDQFEANERLYGLKSNYDESFYTTTIDRSHPEFKQREANALKLAREIEGTATLNSHVAEERGQKMPDDKGEDEEDK